MAVPVRRWPAQGAARFAIATRKMKFVIESG